MQSCILKVIFECFFVESKCEFRFESRWDIRIVRWRMKIQDVKFQSYLPMCYRRRGKVSSLFIKYRMKEDRSFEVLPMKVLRGARLYSLPMWHSADGGELRRNRIMRDSSCESYEFEVLVTFLILSDLSLCSNSISATQSFNADPSWSADLKNEFKAYSSWIGMFSYELREREVLKSQCLS